VDGVELDRSSPEPLHRQLYLRLRTAILSGSLAPGSRLPATRALQEQLGVGRNTVMSAYMQLHAEGYLEAAQGSGTFVARSLPDDLVSVRRPRVPAAAHGPSAPLLSQRGQLLAGSPAMPSLDWRKPRPFYPGVPAYDRFPMRTWKSLVNKQWRTPSADLLGYGTPHGHRPLRLAIAEHLNSVRGVNCSPDQVLVVAGSQQGLDLAARVLLDPGDDVWIEDPAYPGARSALVGAGARLVPVPVDGDGLDVAHGVRVAPRARLAYVTPSHQYPLGSTMSLARRMQLLRWANQHGSWVIEDDYDSEFRYSGRLLPTLQGLDTTGRTIYVGTFSKVMFPSLRLGYVVVPPPLVDGFLAARAVTDRHPPTVDQAVVADFIAEGHFLRHVRRMRRLYAQRQAILLEALHEHCGDLLSASADDAGMHLVGWLAPGLSDSLLAARCAEMGVSTPPLSHYYDGPGRPGVLLGYTGFDAVQLRDAAKTLGAALRTLT
jgi:GntR family transcriptional regulator/MocR family aminotransferase